jgi:glutamate synthase (NADPH/NADH) large chain
VINYFFFVAEELRAIMAEMGFRTVAEMVGRAIARCAQGDPSLEGGRRRPYALHRVDPAPGTTLAWTRRRTTGSKTRSTTI